MPVWERRYTLVAFGEDAFSFGHVGYALVLSPQVFLASR